MGEADDDQLTSVFLKLTGGSGAAGDRRDRLMVRAFPYLLLPHLLSSRNRARRRERGDFSRGLLFGGIGLAVCARAVLGRVLADRPARGLRRARRLPAADRAVVAVPDVPLVPRLQRRRHRAVDVLSVRRSAAAAGGAGRDAAAVSRALPAHGGAVVVDGRRLPGAGADRASAAPSARRPDVLRDGAADGRAVLDHPGRGRHRGDAAAGQHLSGASARATS